jgi:hypothetical protein
MSCTRGHQKNKEREGTSVSHSHRLPRRGDLRNDHRHAGRRPLAVAAASGATTQGICLVAGDGHDSKWLENSACAGYPLA